MTINKTEWLKKCQEVLNDNHSEDFVEGFSKAMVLFQQLAYEPKVAKRAKIMVFNDNRKTLDSAVVYVINNISKEGLFDDLFGQA